MSDLLTLAREWMNRNVNDRIKGAMVDAPINVVKSLGQSVLNEVQALSPVPVYGATQKYPATMQERMRNAVTALPIIGPVLESYEQRGNQYLDQAAAGAKLDNRDFGLDDAAVARLRAVRDVVLHDILPGEEIAQTLTGKKTVPIDPAKNPYDPANQQVVDVTAREGGANFTKGLLKSLVVAEPINAVTKGAVMKGLFGEPTAAVGRTKSVGEILANPRDAAAIAAKNPLAAEAMQKSISKPPAAPTLEGPARVLDETKAAPAEPATTAAAAAPLAEELKASIPESTWNVQRLMEHPEFQQAVSDTIRTSAFEEFMKTYSKEEGPIGEFVEGAIRNGLLDNSTVTRLIRDHNLPVEQAPKIIADVFRRTKTEAGKNMAALSEPVRAYADEVALKAVNGDKAAQEWLRTFEKWNTTVDGPAGFWPRAASYFNRALDFRRGMMVGGLQTAERNIFVQGLNVGAQAYSHLWSGTVEALAGKFSRDGRAWGDYYSDFISDVMAGVHRMAPTQRKALNDLMDMTPLNKIRMKQGAQFDVANATIGNGLKDVVFGEVKYPEQHVSNMFNVLNRMQEGEFREFFYDARLSANMNALGIKTRAELQKHLEAPELDPKVRAAIDDAEVYAMKNTYALTPQSGLAKRVLDMYQKFPILTAVAHPFPRFLINQYRWQLEHSPTMLFNIFSKEFRENLMAGGIEGRQAARQVGDAITGLTLMNAAYALQQSPLAGPKYYQVYMGRNEKGEVEYYDGRSTQPFASFMLFGRVLKSAVDGTPLNITSDEWVDAVTGIRRISDTPLFAFDSIVRNMASDNPDTALAAWKRPLGDIAASYFAPANSYKEIWGAVVNPDDLIRRDTSTQELTGPTRAAIPGVASSDVEGLRLPPRIDPYKGEASRVEHPLLRQTLGVNVDSMTEFERLVNETPGIKPFAIIGKHGTPEANRLVAESIGEILNLKGAGGKTVGDSLASAIREAKLSPDLQKYILEQIFETIRTNGADLAKVKDIQRSGGVPKSFIKKELEGIPPSLRQQAIPDIIRSLFDAPARQ
jgi:hypothetical protein